MQTVLWERSAPASPDAGPKVRCLACMHQCVISGGKTGVCGVRQNRAGSLASLVCSGIVSAHADPVEKKPLYHYLPGTRTYSFGTEGCNFSCLFCQNADISQHPRLTGHVREKKATPSMLVNTAREMECASVAFTYTEPAVFIELVLNTAQLALAEGLGTIMVSNGYHGPQALGLLKPLIGAANIDLKSMNPEFYRKCCGARLQPVLDNLKRMVDFGWWVEVTTLVIPGLNDSPEEFRRLARFVVSELGAHVPWHVSAFHPAYEMRQIASTPLETIALACTIGRDEGLHFVYPGNVGASVLAPYRSTLCPKCHLVCIDRTWQVDVSFDGRCPNCEQLVPGVWHM